MLMRDSSTTLFSMRRRFRQNQEDCTFVLLAQLPTLARHLLTELDVEALTAELQRRAEVAKRDKQNTAAVESSTASLDASLYNDNGASSSKIGEANMDASFHSTLEAAQVPLPQESESVEQDTVSEVSTVCSVV